MQLARFTVEDQDRVGFVDGDELVEVESDWLDLLARVVEQREASGCGVARWPRQSCELLAPLEPSARGVFCIGLNYREHADEVGDELGEVPVEQPPIFLKLPESMLAPNRPLVLDPDLSKEMDWEVELGVVIGKGGRRIAADRVAEHIAGYTIVVDTTARDLQRGHIQWFIGKNAHQSSPIGPYVVTTDEVGFPPALELSLRLNGVEKQRARTDEMIWSIAEFISVTSRAVELKPGDVFATGSPPGVGFTREPPEFLSPGDLLRAEIDKIGVLEHVVR